MTTEGFIERATKIAGDLENNLKRISGNQIYKVEIDFNKPNVAAVVKIKIQVIKKQQQSKWVILRLALE